MGEITGKSNDGIIKAVTEEGTAGGTAGGSGKSTSTATRSGGATAGGTGAGTGAGTGTEAEKARISGMATINEADAEKERKNARRRELYAKKKAENGGQYKPRKTKQKKAETNPLTADSVAVLISTLSAIVGSRPNCEQWILTEAEVKSLAEPIAKIIAENEAFANVGQYSNQIALVMACVTVFVPRVIITVQKQKEVKKIERSNENIRVIGSGKTDTQKAKDTKATGNDSRSTSGNRTDDSKNEPFYGAVLS